MTKARLARKSVGAVPNDFVQRTAIADSTSRAARGDFCERVDTSLVRDRPAEALESFADGGGDRRGDALAGFRRELTSEPISGFILDVQSHL
jgi:hypothetical protein